MPTGVVTSQLLNPITTSVGTVYVPAKELSQLTSQDLLTLVQRTARKRDGTFTVSASAGTGGITLTVTTGAGSATIGPYPFAADQVGAMLDYLTREGRLWDGL